jgi:signal transduction histidine kinase
MGLIGIEERVGHVGGRLEVESAPGRGTSLRVTLPLAATTAAQPAGQQA